MQGSKSQNQNAKMGSEVDGEPVHHKNISVTCEREC